MNHTVVLQIYPGVFDMYSMTLNMNMCMKHVVLKRCYHSNTRHCEGIDSQSQAEHVHGFIYQADPYKMFALGFSSLQLGVCLCFGDGTSYLREPLINQVGWM